MIYTRRVGWMACVLVVITMIGGLLSPNAFATEAKDLRKIVIFKNLINLKTDAGFDLANTLITLAGATVVHNLSLINALAITFPVDELDEVLKFLFSSLYGSLYVLEVVDDLLTFIDPAPICPIPTLPLSSYPWGLEQIRVPEAHKQTSGLPGSQVTVAVLDTGIDSNQFTVGEFADRDPWGYNALDEGKSYSDDNGHGTHMAGIIAAALNNGGINGVAPQAKLVAVKVLDKDGFGYLSDVINGLQWVAGQNIRVVNMSFGFIQDNSALKKAIQALYTKGVIMVAAAGNRCAVSRASEDGGGDACDKESGASCQTLTAITYPAAYESWVIAVGATDMDNHITAYSLSGKQLAIVAPGGAPADTVTAEDNGQILSTDLIGLGGLGYGLGYGTSQAAAHVTGAIALALQVNPQLTFAQVRNLLKTTAMDLGYPPEQQGAGQVNVKKLIEAVLP